MQSAFEHPSVAATLGRYELQRRIAQGGMAEVFLAIQKGPGGFQRTVAIKRILPHLATDQEFVALFLDEARIAANLSHPNICQILDVGQEDDEYFIAMEYLPGPTLGELVAACQFATGGLRVDLTAFIVARAAEALAYAHERTNERGEPLGIVHRDVSPANILVTRDGQVKLLDFGIARAADRLARTRPGRLRGNVPYMSPEQIQGRRLDGRSDVFSLGVVSFESVCGGHPFRKTDPHETMREIVQGAPPQWPERPKISPALRELVDSALQRDPSLRPTARELAVKLEAWLRTRSPPPDPQWLATTVKAVVPDAFGPMTLASANEATVISPSPLLDEGNERRARPHDVTPEMPARGPTRDLEPPPPVVERPQTRVIEAAPLASRPRERLTLIAVVIGSAIFGLIAALVVAHFAEPEPGQLIEQPARSSGAQGAPKSR